MTLKPLGLIASAAHYAGQAGAEMKAADFESEVRTEHYSAAQTYATLALAAATLEAAPLHDFYGVARRAEKRANVYEAALRKAIPLLPESDREWAEGALLTAAMQEPEAKTKLFYCGTEWTDEQSVISGLFVEPDPRGHDGKPHRCNYPVGHEREEPHYCRCGAEL